MFRILTSPSSLMWLSARFTTRHLRGSPSCFNTFLITTRATYPQDNFSGMSLMLWSLSLSTLSWKSVWTDDVEKEKMQMRWKWSRSEQTSTRRSLTQAISSVSNDFTIPGSKGRSLFLLKEKCDLDFREWNLKRKHSEAFAPNKETPVFERALSKMFERSAKRDEMYKTRIDNEE